MDGVIPGDQRAWLHAVLDLLPFPAALIELETARVLFANRSSGTVPLGLPIDGEGVADESHATDSEGGRIPPERMPHRRAARGERLDGDLVTWHTPRGAASFVAFSGTVPAMHGHTSFAVLTFLDVTALKGAEAELRQAIRVRDEFVSVATHELRDPLASLLLSVEVLKRVTERGGAPPPDMLARQLEISKRQGDRLARMIETLLDVSRIASGRSQLDVEAFDVCELVHDVAGRFREQARSAAVPLDVEPCTPTIGYFDRLKLEQVFGNLISNAIKYGAGRPVSIRLRADAETVRLEVQDRGIGIAEGDRGRIFERFERASDGHRRESLGLGLYIVRSLVEAHGGTVEVLSEPGQGSTFTVALPRRRMPQGDAAAGHLL